VEQIDAALSFAAQSLRGDESTDEILRIADVGDAI